MEERLKELKAYYIDAIKYVNDDLKEEYQNIINYIEANKTLIEFKNNIDKLKPIEVFRLFDHKDISNMLYSTPKVQDLINQCIEKNVPTFFRKIHHFIDESQITNWEKIKSYLKKEKSSIFTIFPYVRNDFKIKILEDKEIYDYCIERIKKEEQLKKYMPLSIDLYEKEELNEIIKSKSIQDISYDLDVTNDNNKLLLSQNMELANQILKEGIINIELSDEIINNISINIQELINNNKEIITLTTLKEINNIKLKDLIILKNISYLVDIASFNELKNIYMDSNSENQEAIYNQEKFKRYIKNNDTFTKEELISKTKNPDIQSEMVYDNIEEIFNEPMLCYMIKYLDYDHQLEIYNKLVNGELTTAGTKEVLLNLNEKLLNENLNNRTKESTEILLNKFKIEDMMLLYKKNIDEQYKKMIIKEIKTRSLEKNIPCYQIKYLDKKDYEILFGIITEQELENIIDSYEINDIIELLQNDNLLISETAKKSFIRNIDHISKVSSYSTTALMNKFYTFEKNIQDIILEKIDIKNVVDELGSNDEITKLIINNITILDEIEPKKVMFKSNYKIIENKYIYNLLPDKFKVKLYTYSMTKEQKQQIIKILKNHPEYIKYTSMSQDFIDNMNETEILNLCKYTNDFHFLDSIEDEQLANKIINNYQDKIKNNNMISRYQNIKNQNIKEKIFNIMGLKNYLELLKKTNDKEIVINKILEHQDEFFKEINYFGTNNIIKLLNELPEQHIIQIVKRLSSETLIGMAEYKFTSIFEEEIMNRYYRDVTILKHSSDTLNLIINFKEENKNIIKNQIKQDAKKYLDEDILNKIEDKYLVNIAPIIYNVDKYKNKMDIIKYLQSKNKHLFMTFDKILLEDEIIKLGNDTIEKLARYPKITKMIHKIKRENKGIYNLYIKLIDLYNEDDFDIKIEKISIITDNILRIKELKNILKDEYTKEELKQISNYILEDHYNYTPFNTKNDFDSLKEYYELEEEKNNISFYKSQNLDEKKDIYIKIYFRITKKLAELIVFSYINDLDNIEIDDYSKKFVKNINEILECNEQELQELYETQTEKFEIDEMIYIEKYLKEAYAKNIKKTVNKINEFKTINKKINDIDLKILTDEFKLIVHSTDAYGKMELINNNYLDSWNLSDRTGNHGICTTYITNKNLGLPPVMGNGVLFGFSDFSENAINGMAPYDISSHNDSIRFQSSRPTKYMTAKNMTDYTRHTHNEIVIERTELREEYQQDNVYIQPDYILVTSDMDNLMFENAKKASIELAKNGKPLPIYYIDREYIYEKEAKTILHKIENIKNNYNLVELENIISDYETNRCGSLYSFKPRKYKFDDYISVDNIENIIYEYIEKTTQVEELDMIINILKKEQSKFELVEEATERKCTLNIDIESIIKKIEEKESEYAKSNQNR